MHNKATFIARSFLLKRIKCNKIFASWHQIMLTQDKCRIRLIRDSCTNFSAPSCIRFFFGGMEGTIKKGVAFTLYVEQRLAYFIYNTKFDKL